MRHLNWITEIHLPHLTYFLEPSILSLSRYLPFIHVLQDACVIYLCSGGLFRSECLLLQTLTWPNYVWRVVTEAVSLSITIQIASYWGSTNLLSELVSFFYHYLFRTAHCLQCLPWMPTRALTLTYQKSKSAASWLDFKWPSSLLRVALTWQRCGMD